MNLNALFSGESVSSFCCFDFDSDSVCFCSLEMRAWMFIGPNVFDIV